jgi:hypothetical protein
MDSGSNLGGPAIGRVAFLFLGEMLLVPHLYPIVESLAGVCDLDIDLWVSTSVHEALLAGWIADLANPRVRIRRAPGFRRLPAGLPGRNPPLPSKLPLLARLIPRLLTADVVVCAEQTSLWAPRLLPLPLRFVKTSHGVGSMSARDDPRRRAAWLTLVPSELERETYLARGFDPDRIVATGYVKSAFRQRSHAAPLFPEQRPTVLYAPHWQRRRSSWWDWGEEVLRQLSSSGRYNVIFAPHQRLVETAPELLEIIAAIRAPHVHCDLDSFAMVDGSYTAAADIYLGDTSSQLLEFLARPRPCVFLNPARVAWPEDPAYAQWTCGEVIDRLEDLAPALARSQRDHALYTATQTAFAQASLGETGPTVADRAASAVLSALPRPVPALVPSRPAIV